MHIPLWSLNVAFILQFSQQEPAVENTYMIKEIETEHLPSQSLQGDLIEQLQKQLSKKHMLFEKHHLELGKIVGQGMLGYFHSYMMAQLNQSLTASSSIKHIHVFSLYVNCSNAGESGLVYRGYLKSGTATSLVAIKTGKGMWNFDGSIREMHEACYIKTTWLHSKERYC